MSDMHFLFSARYMHGIVFLSFNLTRLSISIVFVLSRTLLLARFQYTTSCPPITHRSVFTARYTRLLLERRTL